MTRWVVAIVLACCGCGGGGRNDPQSPPPDVAQEGRLASIARAARARGESEVTVHVYYERVDVPSMTALLSDSSIVVATPTRTALHVTPDGISTVQFFTAQRWLRQMPLDAKKCGAWSGPPPRADEVFTVFPKGTAVIDGVTIRDTTFGHMEFDAGQRYLLFGLRCGDGYLGLTYMDDSILMVSSEGRLHPTRFRSNIPPALQEVVRLRTLKHLDQELRRIPAR